MPEEFQQIHSFYMRSSIDSLCRINALHALKNFKYNPVSGNIHFLLIINRKLLKRWITSSIRRPTYINLMNHIIDIQCTDLMLMSNTKCRSLIVNWWLYGHHPSQNRISDPELMATVCSCLPKDGWFLQFGWLMSGPSSERFSSSPKLVIELLSLPLNLSRRKSKRIAYAARKQSRKNKDNPSSTFMDKYALIRTMFIWL